MTHVAVVAKKLGSQNIFKKYKQSLSQLALLSLKPSNSLPNSIYVLSVSLSLSCSLSMSWVHTHCPKHSRVNHGALCIKRSHWSPHSTVSWVVFKIKFKTLPNKNNLSFCWMVRLSGKPAASLYLKSSMHKTSDKNILNALLSLSYLRNRSLLSISQTNLICVVANCWQVDRICGAIGRAVASSSRDLQFEST